MLKLFRTIGAAVALGVGARAGGELYEVIKKHAKRKQAGRGCETSGQEPDSEAGPDPHEDMDAAEERLKAERARINRELERLRRKKAKRKD